MRAMGCSLKWMDGEGEDDQEIHGKKQVEKEMQKAGLKRKDAHDRTKWRDVQTIAMRNIRPPPLTRTKPD